MALHKYDPPELLNTSVAPSSSANSADYQTPRKSTVSPNSNEDSPLTIMSGTSCRDLDAEFAAASPRPFLITGASGWGDDSSDDDDDDLL